LPAPLTFVFVSGADCFQLPTSPEREELQLARRGSGMIP
jgi:hypothetical protein